MINAYSPAFNSIWLTEEKALKQLTTCITKQLKHFMSFNLLGQNGQVVRFELFN